MNEKIKLNYLLFLIGLVGVFVAHWSGLVEVVTRWNKQEEYGHGFFIPMLTLWFLWDRKSAIVSAIGKGSYLSLLFVGVALVFLVLGEVTALYLLIQLGFILSLLGLVLAFGGSLMFRVMFVPIFFLIFSIPLPYFIEALLTAKLQLLSSDFGVAFLRLIGTSVYLEGNLIDLGQYRLQVVEACSGLRYLYPLMSIGFLMAYMYHESYIKKAVIFITTIPITVLMNSARIAMVGILVDTWGNEMADGFLHYFEGWIVFMLCLAILLAEVWVFEKLGQKRPVMVAIDLPKIPIKTATEADRTINYALITYLAFIVLSVAVVNVLSSRLELKPMRQELASFPLRINTWIGSESSLSRQEIDALGFSDYFLADYNKKGSKSVNYYIAYYASQRKGVSPHSPQVCMPGGGWVINSLDRKLIGFTNGLQFEVNKVIIEKGGQKQMVIYWFEQRGRHIASEYWMKWYLFKDALFKNRTDGALIRMVTPISADETDQEAENRLIDLLKDTQPLIGQFVPE